MDKKELDYLWETSIPPLNNLRPSIRDSLDKLDHKSWLYQAAQDGNIPCVYPEQWDSYNMGLEEVRIYRQVVYNARSRLDSAVRRGIVSKQPCEVCGSEFRVGGLHENYLAPLKVRWLCQEHRASAEGAVLLTYISLKVSRDEWTYLRRMSGDQPHGMSDLITRAVREYRSKHYKEEYGKYIPE